MTTRFWKLAAASAAVLAFAAACDNKPAETAAAPAAVTPPPALPAPPPAPDYAALLLAGDRPVVDVGDDAARHPAEVLAFSKIMTGQTVLELEAGSGYYTELLSHAVGPAGKVIMQSPNFGDFYKKDIETRLKDNRLGNVKQSTTNFDALEPADGSIDVVTWYLGPHELYFKPKESPAGFGDPAKSFSEAFRVLKPGGYFVIMDHAAKMGEPNTTGNTLHRIDPMLVKAMATTAGFVLDEESQLLANKDDDHTKNVFDKAIKRHTDQFLLRYKKPA